jgi:hypothetical protein
MASGGDHPLQNLQRIAKIGAIARECLFRRGVPSVDFRAGFDGSGA